VSSTVAAPQRELEDEFGERHVYEPHRVGIPPLGSYLRELWRRRQFAYEMSRTSLRAQHFKTALGQLWLVLNPLLLTFVYFFLVSVLRDESRGATFFAHLMAGLFLFQFIHTSVTQGAKSVVNGGKLILNTAFPRTLLPLSSVITAFMRFLPTLGIYAVVHVIAGLPIGLHLLWAIPVLALVIVFAAGLAMLVAAAQVYFRDISSFLPYFLRIWMYASPVLYYVDEVPRHVRPIIEANPLTPLFAAWSDVLNRGLTPSAELLGWGAAWSAVVLAVGGLFFMSREREFAVRL
jgi:teichoic acid transport system permease protein